MLKSLPTLLGCGAAKAQRGCQQQGRRLGSRQLSQADLLGGGVAEVENSDDQPTGRQCVIEIAGLLTSPDEPFQCRGHGKVRVAAVDSWAPVEGWIKQHGVAAQKLPADVEEQTQCCGGRHGVEVGGIDGGETLRPGNFDEGGDQGVAGGKVSVDGLTADAGSGGDLFHGRIRSLAQYGLRRVQDGVDAAPGIGPAATGRRPGIEQVSHSIKLRARDNLDKLSMLVNSYSMSKNEGNDRLTPCTPRPVRIARPRYGVDAPAFVAVLGTAGVACSVTAGFWRRARKPLAAAATVLLAITGVYLNTTMRGKRRVWERELDELGLTGDERLLDLGCGRGMVLIGAATRLPAGHAVGVDLWSGKDQSGNTPEATLANATAARVADRVEVHTADITALPYADGTFDIVTSALVIHNLPSPEARRRALDEAMRVLRPGGQLLIADFWPMAKTYAVHLGQGTLRPLGPQYWYGGPWLRVTLLHAHK